jgi:hypothetical protein
MIRGPGFIQRGGENSFGHLGRYDSVTQRDAERKPQKVQAIRPVNFGSMAQVEDS